MSWETITGAALQMVQGQLPEGVRGSPTHQLLTVHQQTTIAMHAHADWPVAVCGPHADWPVAVCGPQADWPVAVCGPHADWPVAVCGPQADWPVDTAHATDYTCTTCVYCPPITHSLSCLMGRACCTMYNVHIGV